MIDKFSMNAKSNMYHVLQKAPNSAAELQMLDKELEIGLTSGYILYPVPIVLK